MKSSTFAEIYGKKNRLILEKIKIIIKLILNF